MRQASVGDLLANDTLHLEALTNLQTLGLGRVNQTDGDQFMHVTDAGLAHLKQLKTLKLPGTAVTEAGVAALKAAFPECQVTK